ncbi:hypothetical protein CF327_g6004 [Tilletia walkeri]|uniref:FAD/NAD(P)-binding domain-containing protein n=1 Tax=Tilletia walkeri TaxID=117179 RepID=A0A8X7T3C4_9BASI|nr:hypothetical protein CF327_g6004 [Tilletia walkeri]KAE8267357.1 hypothetical protein A4X09_0g4991 [Tilletia walkeri]
MSTELKNVVIVGAATAGAHAARALAKSLPATHRVVLIESDEQAFYPVASLRGAVVPDYEDNLFAPLDNFFGPSDKTRHVIRSGTRVLEISNTDVLVKTPAGTEERIPLEYAILATGSTYPAPARASSPKTAEAKASFKKMQAQIKDAKSILIVGGGEVGVEFAGEIHAQYSAPEQRKKVTLVSRSEQLISKSTPIGLHNSLLNQLEKLGVEVLLGDSVDLPEGTKTGTLEETLSFTSKNGTDIPDVDFVVVATGTKPAADLWAQADPASVTDGQAKVDHKSLRAESTVLTNWFAAGDVASLPGNKTLVNARTGGGVAAANIVSLIKGGKESSKFSVMNVTVVPLGLNGGASSMFGWVIGGFLTSIIKGKSLFLGQFNSLYNKA